MKFRIYTDKRQVYIIPTIIIDFDLRELQISWLFWEFNFDFDR